MESKMTKLREFYAKHEDAFFVAGVVGSTAVLTVAMNAVVMKRIINRSRIQIDWNLFGPGGL